MIDRYMEDVTKLTPSQTREHIRELDNNYKTSHPFSTSEGMLTKNYTNK